MSNTSASGGYLLPAALAPLPGSLTFQQFLQSVFVGISGLSGDLVRPKWQPNPPKQPDIGVNWMAIALVDVNADANAFNGTNFDGSNFLQRMEDLEVQCAFYGPDAHEVGSALRDGFQVPQNLEALRSAKMGFVSANKLMRVPDLVNERWVDKYEMSVFLRREILRTYKVLTFLSATGTIKSVVGENLKTLALDTNNEEG